MKLRWTTVVCWTLALPLCPLFQGRADAAPPTRILISIGQDLGAPGDDRLRYAERDAARVAQVLTELGDVDPERTYLVRDANATKVREVLSEVRGRAKELSDVVLIIYVSGHGDRKALRLGPTRLPHAELRALMDKVPARLRLLVVDTCTSGALIRRKGGVAIEPFAIDLERARSTQGHVVITSTGPNEPAQEWEALGGALFTHHLLSALRGAGDSDGDGRVTLFETYSYAYDRTLAASTGARAGIQHPAHDIELRGAGDFVMTRPGGRGGGLLLGRSMTGRYVVTDALSGELIAEVDKPSGRPLRLALSAGRYVVRRPEGAFVGFAELHVTPLGPTELTEGDFDHVPYTEVLRRGAHMPRLMAVELALAISTGAVAGSGPTPRLGLGLGRELGPWALALGLEGGFDRFRGQAMTLTQYELWALVSARYRAPLSWLWPFVGLQAGLGFIHQTALRDDEQRIRRVFDAGPLPSRNGLAGKVALLLGLELPLGRLIARLELGAGVIFSRAGQQPTARPLGQARLVLGYRF